MIVSRCHLDDICGYNSRPSKAAQHTHEFDSPGISTLTVEVIADSNFVKRSKDGPNVDLATWQVQVRELFPPPEVSAPGSREPLRFLDAQTIAWEDATSSGAFAYNLESAKFSASLRDVIVPGFAGRVSGSTARYPG